MLGIYNIQKVDLFFEEQSISPHNSMSWRVVLLLLFSISGRFQIEHVNWLSWKTQDGFLHISGSWLLITLVLLPCTPPKGPHRLVVVLLLVLLPHFPLLHCFAALYISKCFDYIFNFSNLIPMWRMWTSPDVSVFFPLSHYARPMLFS